MPQLRIERVPIANLDANGFDHMHLVLEPDIIVNSVYPQDEWLAIEGTFSPLDGGPYLTTEGGSGTATLPDLNGALYGQDLIDAIGTPGERGSRVLSVVGNPGVAWQFMAALARDIDGQRLPYQAQLIGSRYTFNINSSSVIATLLYSIGIEIAQNLPYSIGRTNGWQTLLGTSGNDVMRIESTFTNLVGGGGDDKLHGSDTSGQYERFYGGLGDDEFFWSEGSHTYHGGQLRLDYAKDGDDAINYTGIGTIRFDINPARVPHFGADIVATHATGQDYLLSIEGIHWGIDSDTIHLGEGLELLQERLKFNLDGESDSGDGDRVEFQDSDVGLTVVAATNTDMLFVQPEAPTDPGVGVWLESAEWLVASDHDDTVYLGWDLRGFEAGGGNDFVDARAINAFDSDSPSGYDIEILGGDGNDTIIAGHGRVFADGGTGADRFIVSELSDFSNGMNELVIAGADSSDRLFASYSFFNESGGAFEGASLLPLLGAFSQFEGEGGFANMPQHEGPFTNSGPRSDLFTFEWQTNNDRFFNDNDTQGVIDFSGNIFYNRDGNDLLVHIFTGTGVQREFEGDNGPYPYVVNTFDATSEVLVRVVDFQEGDLGLTFFDIGEEGEFDYSREHGDYTGTIYPNWDARVNILTNNGVLEGPLDPRPDAPTFDPDDDAASDPPEVILGDETSEVIAMATSNSDLDVRAFAGNDTITTGSGNDRLDGGEGRDAMSGGSGHDVYYVDNAGDAIRESSNGGIDTVISTISMALPGNIENLTLITGATQDASAPAPTARVAQAANAAPVLNGTGNALNNTIIGNEAANALSGRGGNDILIGGGGDDILAGGAGSDVYIYFAGDGSDEIIGTGDFNDTDTLRLEGVNTDEISFLQRADTPDDLVILVSEGGRIVVRDFFEGDDDEPVGLHRVESGDGTDWARQDIEEAAVAAGLVINEAPQAVDDDAISLRGPSAVLLASHLLENDRDFEGDTLTIAAVTSLTPEVTASLNGDGNIAIVSTPGFAGAVTLSYTLSDGASGQDTGTAYVALYPNQAPLAAHISDQISAEDTSWTFQLPDGFYRDPDGDPVSLTASGANGAALPDWLSFSSETETFSGQPPQDFFGSIALELTISDGEASLVRPFNLVISPVNDAPVAEDDQGFEVEAGETLQIPTGDLLANDNDVDGDVLTVIDVTAGLNGTASLSSDGAVVFAPDPGFSGEASFDYTVDDGAGGQSTATAHVAVIRVEPPIPATIIGTPGNDRLRGTRDDDVFDGLAGNDWMRGRRGDDVFLGSDGVDVMIGGAGHDTIDYGASPEAVSIFVAGLGRGSGGHAQGDVFWSVETVTGSSHNDTLQNFWGDIDLNGGAGDDILKGGFGSSTLSGGSGSDRLTGGFGDDIFVFRTGDGADVITDFADTPWYFWWHSAGGDTVQLDVTGVETFEQLQNTAIESDNDVTFDFGNGDRLTLENMRLAQLDESDFAFI